MTCSRRVRVCGVTPTVQASPSIPVLSQPSPLYCRVRNNSKSLDSPSGFLCEIQLPSDEQVRLHSSVAAELQFGVLFWDFSHSWVSVQQRLTRYLRRPLPVGPGCGMCLSSDVSNALWFLIHRTNKCWMPLTHTLFLSSVWPLHLKKTICSHFLNKHASRNLDFFSPEG